MANLRQLAVAAARTYGIPPEIFLRQIAQESGFNPRARSSAGALGIAQFMPATARGMGVDPLNPRSALYGAARMDAQNLKKYGNWRDVLSLYNSGRGWSQGRGIAETRNYVQSILGGGSGPGPSASVAAGAGPSAAPAPADTRDQRAALVQALVASSQQTGQHRTLDSAPILSALEGLRQARQRPTAGLAAAPPARAGSGGLPRGGPSLSFLTPFAHRFGLQITSTTGGHHVAGSYHYKRRAEDYAGDPSRMMALMQYALHHPRQFKEAFYDPAGFYVKNGRVYHGSIGGHRDHVHLAR